MTADVALGWAGSGGRPLPRPRAPRGPRILLAVIATAWLPLLAMSLPGSGLSRVIGMPMSGPARHGASTVPFLCRLAVPAQITASDHSMILGAGIVGAIGMWGVTVVAMMLPSTLPAVRHVAVNTLSWRRRRAIDTFVGVYLTVWLGFGAVVILVSPLWSGVRGGVLSAAALATAAVWQLTPQKLAALADCHRPVPLPPLGRRATLGVVKFGLRNGSACLRSCWAMMLAMSVASSGSLLLMIALTGMITAEKRAQRPRHAALLVALSLAGAAMIVTATSV